MRRGWIVTVGRNIYTIDNNLRPRAKDGEFVEQISTVQEGGGGGESRLQDETGFGIQSVHECPLLILYSLNILAWLLFIFFPLLSALCWWFCRRAASVSSCGELV